MGLDITGIGALANAAEGLINHFFPDKTEQEKAVLAAEMQDKMNEFNLVSGQQQINLEEAKSTNWFVAGWRPFVGWICGVAFAYATIIEPFISWVAQVVFSYNGLFPILDTTITMQALFGMLGIAGMRSFEKKHGVEHKR